jgi:hypothetical protein
LVNHIFLGNHNNNSLWNRALYSYKMWQSNVDHLPGTDDACSCRWGPPNNTIGPLEKAHQFRLQRHKEEWLIFLTEPRVVLETEDSSIVSSDDELCSASKEVTEDPGLVEAMKAMELGKDWWNEREWSEHGVQVLEDHGCSSNALTLRDDAEEYGDRLSPFLVLK